MPIKIKHPNTIRVLIYLFKLDELLMSVRISQQRHLHCMKMFTSTTRLCLTMDKQNALGLKSEPRATGTPVKKKNIITLRVTKSKSTLTVRSFFNYQCFELK